MFSCEKIEKIIHYNFKDKNLLKTAFTHSSLANEKKVKSNERLEFLGDSVLSIVVTDRIYHHYNKSEGDLSKIRASLVSESSLAFVMESLKLDEFLMCGEGLKNQKPTKAMLADNFEALVAAIYLDGGIEKAKAFILNVLDSAMSDIDRGGVPDSAKSLLQEKLKDAKIVYKTEIKQESGEKIYHSSVFINGIMCGTGQSTKKKIAEEISAKMALNNLKKK